LSADPPSESAAAELESLESFLGGGAGAEEGGGVGWTLPDATPPPPAGEGLGAAAAEGSSANFDSLLCHACLVARPNSPRMTTRPMPTIATSIAYSDNACPRRFRTGWLRLVSTTMLRESDLRQAPAAEGLASKSHAACPGSEAASVAMGYSMLDKQL
jgi:hypothetical protein